MIFAIKYQSFVYMNYSITTRYISLLMMITFIFVPINFDNNYLLFIIYGFFHIFVFWISFDLIIKNNPKWFFKTSFMIYISHEIILESIEKVIYIFFPHNEYIALLDYFISPIITVCIIVCLSRLLSKHKVYMLLSGNRSIL